jgi:hypothetical protein
MELTIHGLREENHRLKNEIMNGNTNNNHLLMNGKSLESELEDNSQDAEVWLDIRG